MLNSKTVKIAYASIETEIINGVLYVLKDGKKLELPLYMEWCSYDPSYGDYFNELNFWDNAYMGLLTFGIGNKYGYICICTGEVICEPKWDWVSLFTKDGYALINEGCEPFSDEGVIAHEMAPRTGKIGLIDLDFNTIIPAQYSWITWHVSFRLHKAGSRYCNVTRKGNFFPKNFNLNENQPLEHHWFIVNQGMNYGIVNSNNEAILPLELGRLYIFSRGCIIRRGLTYTLYTNDAKIDLDEIYVCMSRYDDRTYLIVKKAKKYAVIRDDGTFASNFAFTFQQAKQFVDIQFVNRTYIGKI